MMADALKKTYWSLLIPAIAALLLAYAAGWAGLAPLDPGASAAPLLAPMAFILSVVLAVAGPIWLRAVFANRVRGHKSVSQATLIRFERRLIVVSLSTPYLIAPAYLLNFPDIFFLGIVLMALYAVYYFYPSKSRIQFEKRIFRVQK